MHKGGAREQAMTHGGEERISTLEQNSLHALKYEKIKPFFP